VFAIVDAVLGDSGPDKAGMTLPSIRWITVLGTRLKWGQQAGHLNPGLDP